MLDAGVFNTVAEQFRARLDAATARLAPYEGQQDTMPLRLLGDYICQAMERFAPDLAR